MRKSCIPPTRSIGRKAIPVTTKPTPPIHCSSARHSRIPCAVVSSPAITVEPVVVIPDIASKKASVNVSCHSQSGSAPTLAPVIQTVAVSRKVCRRCTGKSRFTWVRQTMAPSGIATKADSRKIVRVSAKSTATSSMTAPITETTAPLMKTTKFKKRLPGRMPCARLLCA